jgi:hypothetical protein
MQQNLKLEIISVGNNDSFENQFFGKLENTGTEK